MRKYIILSVENTKHDTQITKSWFYKDNQNGFTDNPNEAGRFSEEEAMEICGNLNEGNGIGCAILVEEEQTDIYNLCNLRGQQTALKMLISHLKKGWSIKEYLGTALPMIQKEIAELEKKTGYSLNDEDREKIEKILKS